MVPTVIIKGHPFATYQNRTSSVLVWYWYWKIDQEGVERLYDIRIVLVPYLYGAISVRIQYELGTNLIVYGELGVNAFHKGAEAG